LHHQLPEIQNTKQQWIDIVTKETALPKPIKRTISLYNPSEQESESVRQLIFSVTVDRKFYWVTVNKSETETQDLLQLIILVTVAMIALILSFNYLINRKLLTRIWKPFYDTIDSIKDYAVNQKFQELPGDPIEEINLLNVSLNHMTERIHRDYFALRSFTENASHEMQTPLAVIRTQVESLYQFSEGKEQMMQQLMAIEDACLKLSKLHQSLLLLTKLENRQFVLNETVDLHQILEQKILERAELFESKSLEIRLDLEKDVLVSFHQHLAEIMISNLLNNAIRYTPGQKLISIVLNPGFLKISNSAIDGPLDSERLFQRFYRAGNTETGTGLGLSIIREICISAGFEIGYFLKKKCIIL